MWVRTCVCTCVYVCVGADDERLAPMGTTNAALSLRRFTQTSFNYRVNSVLPPPIPSVPAPLTPISSSPHSSLSSNG
ncbi:unnamed protein product [Thelazia callipaeda]|uniref:Secreted protein n=1 Tax=Thelazia callipaeda TaxID=103827 RepID=A0A0N5DCC2_THECL|nr:unnamed protein product [Thelazia callipaeda]